ncbi:Arc family DNA-binding protein [Acetobacteraceae bacterium B3987]|nr:Arc family DNA-binding protein [Acetobacteraceae bacterium B3987]
MAKRDDPQFRIRLPADLKKKIEESAKASGRSLNTEIEQRLDFTFNVLREGVTSNLKYVDQEVAIAKKELRVAEAAYEDAINSNADSVEKAIARYEVKRALENLKISKCMQSEMLSVMIKGAYQSTLPDGYKSIFKDILEDDEK